MTTLDRRLSELEKAATANSGPLVLFVDERPTAERLRAIDEAERIRRPLVRLLACDVDL